MSEPGTLREVVESESEEIRKLAAHLAQAGVINLDANLHEAIESAKQKGLDPQNHLVYAGNNILFNNRHPR
ncbi:hypothetical protein [Mycobacteroides chelonae]|uniref:hypothetical protein n=1 Tax=Mycobacteroides chelonae TaxID=1774 RepID=UPI001042423B|nr:hypothetical protein [Mycobacteroides chelonae]QQG88326.1 hypothetical protein HBA99_14745 [Mycobacteroides chelonae]QQG93143.1 hypothetical protein HBA97_14745 [Mycobacteroides chelonae]